MDLNNKNVELYECDYTSSFFMFKNSLNILLTPENEIQYKIHNILPNDLLINYFMRAGEISNRIINPRELGAYFNNLGVLLGKLAILFKNPKNVTFIATDKSYNDILDTVRTYFQVLYTSYDKYIEHFENYMISIFEKDSDEVDIDRSKYSIIKLRYNFRNIIDSMYEYKMSNKEISITTIMGLYYIGLHYSIIGALIAELAKEETIDLEEYLLKAYNRQQSGLINNYISSIDKSKQNISVFEIAKNNQENELYDLFKILRSLMCDDSYLGFFYSSEPVIGTMNEKLVIEKIINNTYKSLLDVFKDQNESVLTIETEHLHKALYIDVHPVLNNLFNLYVYYNPEHILLDSAISLKDCKMPLMFSKTLLNLIQYDSNDIETFSTFEFLSDKLSIKEIDLKQIKICIEKIIASKHEINPNIIFYLLAIASYIRGNIYNKISKTSNLELAIEVVIIAETVIYALYNEWFNEKTKIYKFDRRISKLDNELMSEHEMLNYEILVAICDYVSAIYDKDDAKSVKFEFMPINKLVVSLHPEYSKAFNEFNILSPESVIEEIKTQIKSILDNVSMSDLAINNEFGKRGILPYILLEPKINHLLDYLKNDNAIKQLFAGLENSDSVIECMTSDMKLLLEKIEPNYLIKGLVSESPLYEKINTNMTDIWNSDLKIIEKFYLLYGLNYIFIKNYFALNIKNDTNLDDVIILGDKQLVAADELASLEDLKLNINKYFKGLTKKSTEKVNQIEKLTNKINKYGFM